MATGFARAGIALLGLCGIALVWTGILHTMAAERADAVHGAYITATNLSRAFEEDIVSTVKTVDQTILYLRDAYERDPAGFDVVAWAKTTQTVTDLAFQIGLIDRNGFLIATNLAPTGDHMDLSDREHFRVPRDNPRDELFISKPVFGRASNKWSIQFTRKLIGPDGAFDGVIVISLDPDYFARFYASIDHGRDGTVALLGADGVVRARAGGPPPKGAAPVLGRSFADSNLMRLFARSPEGRYAEASPIDGVKRFFAYRGVRGAPLLVNVGLSEAETFAALDGNRRAYLILGTLVTALLVVVTGLLLVRQAQLSRAREKLRVDYARKSDILETTLENMNQGIIMIDADGRVLVSNRWLIETFALPRSLMDDNPPFERVLRYMWQRGEFGDAPGDFDVWVRSFRDSGALDAREWASEHVRPDGTVVEARGGALPDGGMIRTYTDITERKRAEAALRAARDAAEQAARAKSEFLATMSHEIRSPMSGLLGVLELLRASNLTDEQSRMAGMVQNSGLMLLAVLNDILDFSKIEAGAMSIAPEPTDARALVDELVAPRLQPLRHKGIAVGVEIDDAVPARIATDPLRLRQILGNLLSNAAKFTAHGTVSVGVGVVTGEIPAERWLRFTVRDTGIGMSEEVIGRLFNPFTQADGSTTRNYGGTGLGLSISRKLALLLGGDLSVTSRLGEGSAFSLMLPLVACDAPAAPTPAEATAADQDRRAARGRVLVVDDDQTNRWLARRQLEKLGLTVDTADDGLAGFEKLQDGRYDLLLTDCHMPVMDGVALTRAVRAAGELGLRAIPVIGLTADVTEEQRARCAEAGMTELAIKPLGMAKLAALLARHLPTEQDAPTPVSAAGLDAVATAPAAPPVLDPPVETNLESPFESRVFDDSIFREIFDDGDPVGAAWLAEFLVAAHDNLVELARLFGPKDMALDRGAIAAVAHRLAGAAFSAGAMRLGDMSRALERAAPGAAADILRAVHDSVRSGVATAETAITAFLARGEVQGNHGGSARVADLSVA